MGSVFNLTVARRGPKMGLRCVGQTGARGTFDFGIQPCAVGDLPTVLAAIGRTNINAQELAVEGSLS